MYMLPSAFVLSLRFHLNNLDLINFNRHFPDEYRDLQCLGIKVRDSISVTKDLSE